MSTESDSDDDDDSRKGRGAPRKRVARVVNTWNIFDDVQGWDAVQRVLRTLEQQQCDGASFLRAGSNTSAAAVSYRFRCAFYRHHKYPYQVQVQIPKHLNARPTFAVVEEMRTQTHEMHRCIIEVAMERAHRNRHF